MIFKKYYNYILLSINRNRLLNIVKNYVLNSHIYFVCINLSFIIGNTIKGLNKNKNPLFTIYILLGKIILTVLYMWVYFTLYTSVGLTVLYTVGTLMTFCSPEKDAYLFKVCCSIFWGSLSLTTTFWVFLQFDTSRSWVQDIIGMDNFEKYLGLNPGSILNSVMSKTYLTILVGSLAARAGNDLIDRLDAQKRCDLFHEIVLKSREQCSKDSPIHQQPTMTEADIRKMIQPQSSMVSAISEWIKGKDHDK